MILDAGALLAVDRGDRAMMARLLVAFEADDELKTHSLVVAQAWRDPRGRQALLARLLRSVRVLSIDEAFGRRAGELLGEAGSSDPIGAAVVLIAADGDAVVTSDPADIQHLARTASRRIVVVSC